MPHEADTAAACGTTPACRVGRRSGSHTWRRPNRSKWLMRNVTISTVPSRRQTASTACQRDGVVLDRPDRDPDRTPLPEQQQQRQAGAQHVGRALDRPRHDLRPSFLEPAPRHHAVLHGEDGQQRAVDRQRSGQRAFERAVEPTRHERTRRRTRSRRGTWPGRSDTTRRRRRRTADVSARHDLLWRASRMRARAPRAPSALCPGWARIAAPRCETNVPMTTQARHQEPAPARPLRDRVGRHAPRVGASRARGPIVVKAANWLTHLEYEWHSPVWKHWLQFFSAHFRFVRYDERGCGMSDWQPAALTLEQWAADLGAVIDAAQPEGPVTLLGISQGAATCIHYALRHPERVARTDPVRRLRARRAVARNAATAADAFRAMIDLARVGLGQRQSRRSARCSRRASFPAARRSNCSGSTTSA